MSSMLSYWRRRSSSMACQRTGSTSAIDSCARPRDGEMVMGRPTPSSIPGPGSRRGSPLGCAGTSGLIFPRTPRPEPLSRRSTRRMVTDALHLTVPPLDAGARASLEQPALVIDLGRTDAAIHTRGDAMRARGVTLRPHAKTHKSLAVGRRQLDAGAVGLTVGTLGEAEVFAAGGFDDLFIA